jgi:transposase
MAHETTYLWAAAGFIPAGRKDGERKDDLALRDRHVKDAGRAVQHMQKALTKMNIQLANVISDISGVSGQAIIGAVLKGERDPWKLADLRHEMVRASREEVARSLEGNWRDDLIFELRQAVDSFHFAHQRM